MKTYWPNEDAATNSRPVGQSDGSEDSGLDCCMRTAHSKQKVGGFTFWDLLIVLVTVTLAVILVVLWRSRPKRPMVMASRIDCVSNIKQVGMCFRMWANDNNDQFPMAVSTNKGGSMEYNGTGQVFRHFQAMSNELFTPKVLSCPQDSKRSRATNWVVGFTNQNVSYFVGLDAVADDPQMILSGDRNITGGITTNGNIMLFASNSPAGWTKAIHVNAGTIGLADGSAQQVTVQGLRQQLRFITNGTIRLAIP